jgi:hypothetical protein
MSTAEMVVMPSVYAPARATVGVAAVAVAGRLVAWALR